jgi:PAP_fibrillin
MPATLVRTRTKRTVERAENRLIRICMLDDVSNWQGQMGCDWSIWFAESNFRVEFQLETLIFSVVCTANLWNIFCVGSSGVSCMPMALIFLLLASIACCFGLSNQPTVEFRTSQSGASRNAVPTTLEDVKRQLIDLGAATNCGFRARPVDRNRARDLIKDLSGFATVAEPARDYYNDKSEASTLDSSSNTDMLAAPTLRGQWTLIYTDAPDITSLGSTNPWAELGRIGQDCSAPPLIQNVIEWKRPSWATNLPGSGSDQSRVLQKVITRGSARPSHPTTVNLAVAGLALQSRRSSVNVSEGNEADTTAINRNGLGRLLESIQSEGLIAGLLQNQAVDLRGPWDPPLGSFEILYLDQDFRVTRTNQNYVAVNTRVQPGDEWF